MRKLQHSEEHELAPRGQAVAMAHEAALDLVQQHPPEQKESEGGDR